MNKILLFISYNLPIEKALALCYTIGEESKEVHANVQLTSDPFKVSAEHVCEKFVSGGLELVCI